MISRKLLAGAAAFGIYFLLLALLLYYFGYHSPRRAQHFVVKNEKGIEVTLAGAPAPRPTVKKRPNPPKKKTRHAKPRNLHGKPAPKRKASAKKAAPRKTPDAKSLFSKVKVPKQKPKEAVKKAANRAGKQSGNPSLKKRQKEQGIQNAYLARVERLLKGWPAQANFAGEEIDIHLTIYPDGRFDYRVLRFSGNPDFNHELTGYLRQLQGMGFGPHGGNRPYEVEVHFVAHE